MILEKETETVIKCVKIAYKDGDTTHKMSTLKHKQAHKQA